MKPEDREIALRIIWDSLQSHLPYMYKKSPEGRKFHAECVRDYGEAIYRLTKDL